MKKPPRAFLGAVLLAAAPAALAQADPFTLPSPRPASPGAYQWSIEMLRFDRAWLLTKGRAHVAMSEKGAIAPHEDLGSGLDGPQRPHLSEDMAPNALYHSTMTLGVLAARGFNGRGIAGGCPFCSVSMFDGANPVIANVSEISQNSAIDSGASVLNYSAGGSTPNVENPSCTRPGTVLGSSCRLLERAEERDVVYVTIAGNSLSNRIGHPANYPTAIGVAGLQPDGQFWTNGFHASNPGSNYGPEVRLVAPSTDLLLTHPVDGLYSVPEVRCADRVDSAVGEARSLPASYAGYGDCNGTSFAAPHVAAIAALMRSANPLLSAAQVRAILYETATRPVAGPAGSGLTFYIPDAEAAVKRALPPGANNRVTPMFSLYSSAGRHHLFTSSPQAAVAGAAGEMRRKGLAQSEVFESFGDPVPGYERFVGRICTGAQNCVTVPARKGFYVFATENGPDSRALAPLYRMTQVCAPGPGCATTRAFAYATSDAAVHDLESRGYALDMVEGFVYPVTSSQPAGTTALCLAFDAERIDHILYAASQCGLSQLRNAAGETTGGSYQHVAVLGYVPDGGFVAPSYAGTPNRTGMWWNPDESGWGVNFAQQGDTVFATLFTYDDARRPLWLVMPSGLRQPGVAEVFSGALYRTTGPAFNANPFTPIGDANVTQVGQMRVTFGITSTSLEYDVGGVRVVKAIRKEIFGTRASECAVANGARAGATNYQDMWWVASESGWGINIAQQDDVLFATLFTYASDGKALWLVMSRGTRQQDGSYLGDLYRTTGSAFNTQPFPPLGASDVVRVGSMRLRFTSGEAGTLEYSVDGVPVTKSIVREVFSSPAPECRS